MNGRELFETWAPAESTWSRWAKPVLFADVASLSPQGAPDATEAASVQSLTDRSTAIIVDLPGPESVLTGLELARQGFRPVPLFNNSFHPGALVNVGPVLRHLLDRAEEIRNLALPPDAPPAFLLDSRRMMGDAQPGSYDNRWMVFPQDFPSASFLLSRSLHRATVLQPRPDQQPAEDLAHVLLRWQEAGIEISAYGPAAGGLPQPLQVRKPSKFRHLWYRALVLMRLRRNSAGGFGSVIPMPSSGGHGFG